MATAMDPFSMFMLTTGPAFLKNDESIINAVVRNSYLLPRFMEGKDADFLLQGGTQIQDIIYLNEDSDAEFYKSDAQDFSYRNQQVGTQWNAPWRFLKNSTSWTDHEVGLNESGSLSDKIGRFHRFKRIQRLKFMNLWTTQIHKMEDGLFATQNRDKMEAGDGSDPYSLFSFITTPSTNVAGVLGTNNGLPNQGASTSAWTAVQNIAPSTTVGTAGSRWRNQQAGYAVNSTGDVAADQFWTGMRELHHKCKFERLPRFGSFSEPSRSPSFYAVSLWGLILAESNMRTQNDAYLAGRQDPAWPAPMFHGVPFVYASGMNAATWINGASDSKLWSEQGVAHDGTADATDATLIRGPRVLAINGQVVNLIMHRDRVFYRVPPFSPDRQPFLKVMVTDTWYNLVTQNRRELGVLCPVGATTTTDLTVPAAPSIGV